jgi:DEAD/DEAH box helicase domain-containing protein
VAVFYPLKALASDQYDEWRRWARDLLGTSDAVGRIDGSVRMNAREDILSSARIVLMTPDVCHAWLMSNLASPRIKDFVRQLSLVVLDEAHTLEGVFGSNFAYFMRRLNAARSVVWEAPDKSPDVQFIATTATILDAPGHLADLTGARFVEIGPECDGSPQSVRKLMHVASPTGEELSIARQIQVDLLQSAKGGSFITFVDSRRGVELLAHATNASVRTLMPSNEVLPYRAGLAAEDRRQIENALRAGSLRGVISTSALELGIDLPQLEVGLNVGVPSTRKSFRQRLGRIGRTGPGAFIVIAPPLEFRRFGMTLREYYDRSVEPSYLYLSNRFMQFAHARCLVDEMESLAAKDRSKVPLRNSWPAGFEEIYGYAGPTGRHPREFDAVAFLGGDTPQRSYPLRNVAEINFKIAQGEQADALGEATLPQALRECYPGATYFYMAKPYKVQAWRTGGFEPIIRVTATPGARVTKPRIRTWINATVTTQGVVDRHFRKSADGFLTECEMQITERVQGFEENGDFKSYGELRERNPNMKPRMRQFRTSGVVLCMTYPWFRDATMRAQLSDEVLEIFCREYSVLRQDVGKASSNISIKTASAEGPRADCIAIYDQTYGSLRLTERLYLDFRALILRLKSAAEMHDPGASTLQVDFLSNLINAEAALEGEESGLDVTPRPDGMTDEGLRQVYAAGSKLGYREIGMLRDEVEIVAPTIMPDGSFMYQVKFVPTSAPRTPVKRWVNPDYLEALGDEGDWSFALWNPITGEYVDPNESNETDS